MKRSFAETESTKHEIDRKQALAGLQQEISDIQSKISCSMCDADITEYYSCCARLATLDYKMKVCTCMDTFSKLGTAYSTVNTFIFVSQHKLNPLSPISDYSTFKSAHFESP